MSPPDAHLQQRIDAWLEALEARHLAGLTRPELTRALRALSSCYVERRGRLTSGDALATAGKRAAFALFYGPLHFVVIREIVRALGADRAPIAEIVDLGCGTGAAGAAWALVSDRRPRVRGVDRSAWAVGEANWTYRALDVDGRAKVDNLNAVTPSAGDRATLLAYAVNELPSADRMRLLRDAAGAADRGARLLIVEAISIRDKPWWPEWTRTLASSGARADEWRFQIELPPLVRELGHRAGLTLRELTARSIVRL